MISNTLIYILTGFFFIAFIISLFIKQKPEKEITITVLPDEDNFYMTISGFTEKERVEISNMLKFEMAGIAKKVVDYENSQREEEIQKTKEGRTQGNTATS